MEQVWKVVLADDHREVRSLLKAILEQQEEWQIVGEAANGLEAVNLCAALQPHVVVLDVSMPVMNGIEAARLITKTCEKTKIVFISILESASIVRQSLSAGGRAYVIKNHAASILLTALETVKRGDTYLCPVIMRRMSLDKSQCA